MPAAKEDKIMVVMPRAMTDELDEKRKGAGLSRSGAIQAAVRKWMKAIRP